MKKEMNYLDRIPHSNVDSWIEGIDGNVILHIKSKGVVITVVAWLFKRSRVSKIPLDDLSSLAWRLIDGKRTIKQMGAIMEESIGTEISPVYERLSLLIKYMAGQGLILFSKKS